MTHTLLVTSLFVLETGCCSSLSCELLRGGGRGGAANAGPLGLDLSAAAAAATRPAPAKGVSDSELAGC